MPPTASSTLVFATPAAVGEWRSWLDAAGASVTWVDSAEAAVERAMEENPDIVMLDGALPGIGALAAADILRRAGYAGALVGLLGDGTPSEPSLFDHVLRKPFDAAALRQVVDQAGQARHEPLDAAASSLDFSDLAGDFHAALPAALEALRAAAAAADIAALRRQAHSLKGSAAVFGWPGITRDCAAIEERIAAGQPAAAIALATAMIDHAQAALRRDSNG